MGELGVGDERRLIRLVGGRGQRVTVMVRTKILCVRAADLKFDYPLLTKCDNVTGVMRLAGGG